jgi:hypothetical protein
MAYFFDGTFWDNCGGFTDKRIIILSKIRMIIFSWVLISTIAARPSLPAEKSPIISPAVSIDRSPKAIAAAKQHGQKSAEKDINAGEFRILYYGKPWSVGKPLVDDITGYRVQIVAGCDVSEPFVAEVTAYNNAMRDWHSNTKTGQSKSIPEQLAGHWLVKRMLPTNTISCWSQTEIDQFLGTELQYSRDLFRWKNVFLKNPQAEISNLSAEDFSARFSGGSATGSQVNFKQLGISQGKVTMIVIRHPPADITGSTVEIPGDQIFIKDPSTIIVTVCNVYFEAK